MKYDFCGSGMTARTLGESVPFNEILIEKTDEHMIIDFLVDNDFHAIQKFLELGKELQSGYADMQRLDDVMNYSVEKRFKDDFVDEKESISYLQPPSGQSYTAKYLSSQNVEVDCYPDGKFVISGTAQSGGGNGNKLSNLFILNLESHILKLNTPGKIIKEK